MNKNDPRSKIEIYNDLRWKNTQFQFHTTLKENIKILPFKIQFKTIFCKMDTMQFMTAIDMVLTILIKNGIIKI